MLSDAKINIPGGIDFALPRMAPARQHFERHSIADVAGAVSAQLARAEVAATVKPGASIAIGVGSRGVANIDIAVKALVAGLKARGHRAVQSVEDEDDLAAKLADDLAAGDFVVCLGAGDITYWAAGLANGIAKASSA